MNNCHKRNDNHNNDTFLLPPGGSMARHPVAEGSCDDDQGVPVAGIARAQDCHRSPRFSRRSTMIIRNATQEDIDGLVELLKELFSFEEDFEFDEKKQRRGLKLLLDGCGKHRCVRVAVADHLVIGMATVQTLISTAEGGMVGLVEDVVVQEGWRGKGVGGSLLRSIERWAEERGLLRLQLLADKSNAPAIHFYKKHHWHDTDLECLRKTP